MDHFGPSWTILDHHGPSVLNRFPKETSNWLMVDQVSVDPLSGTNSTSGSLADLPEYCYA